MVKKDSNLILIIAIILVVISLISCCIVLFSDKKLTGYAVDEGYINVTVITVVDINVSQDTINWGPGIVNTSAGYDNATLTTFGGGTATVEGGNWSTDGVGSIEIMNTGNINCSLKLQTAKNAHDLFGSLTSTNELYELNVSDKEEGSCSGGNFSTWETADKNEKIFCNQFDYNINNELYLNVKLAVPKDATNTGELSDVITITGDTAIS